MYAFLRQTLSLFGLNRRTFGIAVATALIFGSNTGTRADVIFDFELIEDFGDLGEGLVVGPGSLTINGDSYIGSGIESFCPAASGGSCAEMAALATFDILIDGTDFAITDDGLFPSAPVVIIDDGEVDSINAVITVMNPLSI